jgi:hypothetical protein
MRLATRPYRFAGFSIVLTLIMVLSSAADERIRFKRGATSAQAAGYLSGSLKVCYLLKALGGQHMKVKAEAKGSTMLEVTTPSGAKNGEPGGELEEDLPETGDYRICVSESSMGEHWKGQFKLTVEIR